MYGADFDEDEHIVEWKKWAEAIPFYLDESNYAKKLSYKTQYKVNYSDIS